MKRQRTRGFTLVEILVTIGIIGVLAGIVTVALQPTLKKGRDAKRKADISQFGRFLAGGGTCFQPDGGPGEYDFSVIVAEFKAKNPQWSQAIGKVPRDPRLGSDEESYYKYVLSADGQKCAIYANLENEGEPVTIEDFDAPTPGGGTGVLEAASEGWNGSTKYFQASN